MNSQKIGVTTRSMLKGDEFLTSKPAGESDKGVSLASGRSTSAMKHKPNETASEKLAVRSNKGESRSGSQIKSSSTRKSKSSTKTKSSGSGSTGSNSSSYSSAKAKKAVLLARLKSNNKIESLKQQQSKERFDFEEEQLKCKLFQREEELKVELKQKRIQEEEDLRLSRLRDEQERKHQQQLEEARLRAELDEAQAVMDIHEINKQTNLSSDVPPFHDNKHIVSNLFCNKYASNGIKIDGPSESTAHPTYDKCNPNDDRLTKSMFIADTKLASSASQNHNLGQNVNPEPPFEHSVTQVPGTLNELCYHQSGQLRDVSNRPSFDYSRANAPTCETRFAQSTRGSNLEPVDYNQTIMVPTQQPSSYSRSNVDQPETSNKELSTSSRNFPVPNAAYQSPVIMSPSATPLLEPDVFDGNPACYRNFIEAFDALIAFNVPEPKRILFYLLSYTKGPAHSLVKGCQYMDDALGYLKARKLLQQTFGQKFQIAKACVDSLTNGPMLHVNDKPSLISFSADINSCMNTLKGMNYLHKMDNLDVITKVAKRLPHQWLSGWQAEVDSLIHQKGQEVSIENLAAYVTIKTRQTTNLDCNWAQSSRKPDLHKPRKETTLATQTVLSPSKPCCKLCKGPHYLNQCKRFRKYVYKDRIKFVNESKLCRSCLEPGHFAKNCSRKSPCKRPDCNGSHTTLLHPPERCTPLTSATNQMDSPADSALSHIAVRNGLVGVPTQTRGSLPIVPVRIRTNNSEQSIITQAFLDTGSTSSFITNDLIDKLGIRQSPVVKVTTVTINHGTDTRKAKVISDLEISDVFESSPYSHLQPLLSIQRLPATIDDAPSQEDISEFPEFANIFIPRVNSDVGLLIGNDNRHLTKPHEIISSESDHYAIRTAVGWVVNCSKKGSSTKSSKSFFAKTESGYVHPMSTLCSKQNPADDPSRDLTTDKFLLRDRRKLDPDVLWKTEDKRPDQPTLLQENLPEQKIDIQKHSCLAVRCELPHFLDDLISRYPSWQRLLRVCAWILRFKNLVSPTKSEYTATVTKPKVHVSQKRITCLSLEEISKAEMLIISYLQHIYYKEEIDDLSKGKPVRTSSSLIKLSPFMKNGLMHVGGRLKLAASLPFLQKHQIILPRSNHVTNLIIRDILTKLGHAGRQHVLAEIRKKFWLIRANATIRKILNSCVACRKRSNISCTQQMADLPPRRLTPNKPPFSSVGVDFFGPFLTRKGRSNSKRYGVIFTCLTTRAIHLEVAYNLDTSSFIQALRRFVARRGQVTEIVSDNGTNFIGGERELREAIQAWNNEQINDFLLQKGISWSFNPPGASHYGGTWERLIRSIRKHLKSVCNEQILTDESLSTLMCEIESILNSRPLTTVSNDRYDLEPLTPNHLLLLKPNESLPPGVFDKRDSYSRKQWRQVQYLANVFWSRWIKEYLPTLQRRQKWTRPARNLTVNDVVLVHNKGLPRNTWLLGRIVEVYPDPSGFVRTVKLQTKQSYITRPITKLTLLHAAES